MNEQELYAYALGYFHARAHGKDMDCFVGEADLLRHLYRRGYDAGISDYCGEDLGEYDPNQQADEDQYQEER